MEEVRRVESRGAASGDDLQHPWADNGDRLQLAWADEDDLDGVDDDDDGEDLADAGAGVCEVSEAEVIDNVPADRRDEVGRLADRVRRRAADQRLFDEMVANGFTGLRWRLLGDDLVRYGLAVVDAWLRSGYIFAKTAEAGRPVYPGDWELRELRSNLVARTELADAVVAPAFNQFREYGVAGTGWRSYEGGASMGTFLVGGCVLLFSNEFRRWRREQRRWSVNESMPPDSVAEHYGSTLVDVARGSQLFDDPARAAADGDYFGRVLAELKRPERVILELADAGYTQAEISEVLGTTERAVEGRLYRLRRKDIRFRVEGNRDDG